MDAWAIIVGINQHPADADLTELHGAVADAADFAEWCLDPAGGAVPPERLFFWTYPGPDKAIVGPRLEDYLKNPTNWPHPRNFLPSLTPRFDRAPKSGEIRALVRKIRGAAFGPTPQRAYIHFAGHGVQLGKDGKNDTCFLVGDYVEGLGIVPCEQLSLSLQTAGFAEVLLFLDCCRSPMSSLEPLPNLFEMGALPQSISGLASAAAPGKASFEFPDQPPKRGAFTKALTEGLRGQRDANGELTFTDLGAYVAKQVPAMLGKPQSPQFQPYPPNDPLVVVRGPAKIQMRTVTVDFPPEQQGKTFSIANEPDMPTIVAGPSTHSFQVPVGRAFALISADLTVIRPFGSGDAHVP